MCSHFDPLLDNAKLETYFGVSQLPLGLKTSLWPGYVGPFIRKHEFADVGDDAVPFSELLVGSFGLIPHWAKDTKIVRKTYNARSETADSKPSFRDAWKKSQHCIIPAEAIYEPDWRSGVAIPTRIVRSDGKPMGIAGLWSVWKNPQDCKELYSFTMLTINADEHDFMKHYHKPQDEKRMIVILQDDQYKDWLFASPVDTRQFLNEYPAGMMRVST
ncbi:SOS response-associated peptidase [uncultured Methylophaga sp.]|uniref:SOS response-associated peptidase n=1 Tax=uncultured Methylophaga sp. TaxID=285271 RepID=UPI002605A2E0|nr:SOS response-associated peptidase [uncultured Methylophaga sp.]